MKSTNNSYQSQSRLKLTVEEREKVDLERLARLLIEVARQRLEAERREAA